MDIFNKEIIESEFFGIELSEYSGQENGSDLIIKDNPIRTVVVYYSDNDSNGYYAKVLNQIFKLSPNWFLFPCGSYKNLEINNKTYFEEVVKFSIYEFNIIIESLIKYKSGFLGKLSDIYIYNEDQNILIHWDHHMLDSGMRIFFGSKDMCSRLLLNLNEIEGQFELFSSGNNSS